VATVARFTFSPTNPTINQDISFNGSSSSASNGTYVWDFGDGQNGSNVTTTHRYTRGGTFTITMTVTSDNRQTSTSSRTITVSTTLPATAANFTFSPTNPAINQDVVFTASGTPVPGGPGGPGIPFPIPGAPPVQGATYAWDFGDGTSGVGTSLTHRYTRGGTFAVTLRVTSDTGLTATTSRQLTISTTLPAGSANFVFSPTDPHTEDVVFFNASQSTLVNGTFSWDFGDGNRGSGATPTHSYATERTFTVTLTVRNELGQSATISKTITVANPVETP
jgi:PKD repeat protein